MDVDKGILQTRVSICGSVDEGNTSDKS